MFQFQQNIKTENQGKLKAQLQVSSSLTDKGKLEMSGIKNISLGFAKSQMFAVRSMAQN